MPVENESTPGSSAWRRSTAQKFRPGQSGDILGLDLLPIVLMDIRLVCWERVVKQREMEGATYERGLF